MSWLYLIVSAVVVWALLLLWHVRSYRGAFNVTRNRALLEKEVKATEAASSVARI